MAGDWIKMRTTLRRHPKVVRIASALKADRLRIVGGLHAVWSVFDEHSADGILEGYTLEAMDDEIGFPGFCAQMQAIGWLDSDGHDGLMLREFDTHNGTSAKRRAQETERKRLERKEEKAGNKDVEKKTGAGAKRPKVVAPDVPDLSATDADKNADSLRTREEKRREEIKETPLPPAKAEGGEEGDTGLLFPRGFRSFWELWPKNERKQDRAKCLAHWRSNGLEKRLDEILADIRVKLQTRKWAEGYIEAPLVYLRGKRWEDGVVAGDTFAPEIAWDATRSTIEAMGVELGLGEWDEGDLSASRESFPAYTERVRKALERRDGMHQQA